MSCYRCGEALEDTPIGFRHVCDACGSWLHCCLGCKHYAPGRANDCAIPDTDLISDREASNLCEYFTPLGHKRRKDETVDDLSKRLFGESAPEGPTLEDLFLP